MAAFTLGERLTWSAKVRPYERRRDDPVYRRLRLFALDPAGSRLDGAVAEVLVPYEPVTAGPVGAVFEVIDRDDSARRTYVPLDLNEPRLLILNGLEPSPTDWRSHQQMVYALAMRLYDSFRTALGRDPSWGFDAPRLRLRPHAMKEDNAYYDQVAGEVAFGYFKGRPVAIRGRRGPEEWVFTCLSHGVVAHELSHALLDGLRTRFMEPTGPDVLGFHEGFSDLVALLHRFTYREVVRRALGAVRGDLSRRSLLSGLAVQFGGATGSEGALRDAIDTDEERQGTPLQYTRSLEAHDMGQVLLSAVFESFATVFRRRTARLLRLASGGTGVLPEGDLPHDLVEALTDEANQLAESFLRMCIRAIDYCPAVDVELGEFLRAIITADQDLVPDDTWGFRETLIHAFRRRGIYPMHVPTLSEDALRWCEFDGGEDRIEALSFARLRFAGDPGRMADTSEIERQAVALGEWVTHADRRDAFGLGKPGRRDGMVIEPPIIESVRTARRVTPMGGVAFDLVAEIVQPVDVKLPSSRARVTLYNGATVIIGPNGQVRYAITKRAVQPHRLKRQLEFIGEELNRSGRAGLWRIADGRVIPEPRPFRAAHTARREETRAEDARIAHEQDERGEGVSPSSREGRRDPRHSRRRRS